MRIRWKFLIIALIALLMFFISKGPPPGQNHFVYLADAFLHGRLGVSGGGTGLAEIVPFNGNYFVVYPPMPAVLLLPFVALFGTSFDQSINVDISRMPLRCSNLADAEENWCKRQQSAVADGSVRFRNMFLVHCVGRFILVH